MCEGLLDVLPARVGLSDFGCKVHISFSSSAVKMTRTWLLAVLCSVSLGTR